MIFEHDLYPRFCLQNLLSVYSNSSSKNSLSKYKNEIGMTYHIDDYFAEKSIYFDQVEVYR